MERLIECGTCGYPLTPEEREGLVEIDGKMCKPRQPLTDEEVDALINSVDSLGIGRHVMHKVARAIEKAHKIGEKK